MVPPQQGRTSPSKVTCSPEVVHARLVEGSWEEGKERPQVEIWTLQFWLNSVRLLIFMASVHLRIAFVMPEGLCMTAVGLGLVRSRCRRSFETLEYSTLLPRDLLPAGVSSE